MLIESETIETAIHRQANLARITTAKIGKNPSTDLYLAGYLCAAEHAIQQIRLIADLEETLTEVLDTPQDEGGLPPADERRLAELELKRDRAAAAERRRTTVQD